MCRFNPSTVLHVCRNNAARGTLEITPESYTFISCSFLKFALSHAKEFSYIWLIPSLYTKRKLIYCQFLDIRELVNLFEPYLQRGN